MDIVKFLCTDILFQLKPRYLNKSTRLVKAI